MVASEAIVAAPRRQEKFNNKNRRLPKIWLRFEQAC
jgi:hypothetical protein